MNKNELNECFEYVLKLTKQCGKIIEDGIKNSSKIVNTKTVFYNLVTEYDLRVENELIEKIKEKYSHHKFLAEEQNSASGGEKYVLTNDPTWIIDPIDGTTNFTRGIPFCSIAIALVVERTDILLAIVYNPCLDELFTAKKGEGAFLNGKRINVSSAEVLNKSLIAHETSIASFPPATRKVIAREKAFSTQACGTRCLGCASLILSYIACGKIDAFPVEYLWPWDIAAGALLVREAGGVVMNLYGGEYDILKPNVIAASTKTLANTILEIILQIENELNE
uniref:Inositol-1-monophosphatase n=1 Tax=Corethrella appendiculata TaxID=1370023 RepID=U5EXR2_9DIPT